MLTFAIIAGVVTLVAIALYTAYRVEKARAERFAEVAQDLGLTFESNGAPEITSQLSELRLFNRGHGRKFKNMMYGKTNDVEMAIFGYQFTTGSGKNQHTASQSVISFRSDSLRLPDFELRPEGFFHKIGQAFGYKDINFDSHPDFSKAYLLKGPAEEQVRQCFTDLRLDFFESMKGVSVEAGGDRLIFYRSGKRIKPEEVRSLMADGFRVFKLFDAR